MTVFEVKTIASLEALEEESSQYNAFLDRLNHGWSFYYRTPFLRKHFDYSDREEELAFILIFHHETLVAVAPFVQIVQKWSRFWIRRLEFIGVSIKDLGNEYPAILIDPEVDEPAILRCLSSFLDSGKNSWDQLDLSGLVEGPQFQFFQNWMKGEATITLDAGFQTSFSNGLGAVIDNELPKSRMREVKRLSRKILRDYPSATYELDYGLTEKRFDEIFSLHSRRQEEKRQRGAISSQSFFDDPKRHEKVKTKLMCLSEITDLRVYRLMIDDKLVAFNLTIRSGETEYGLFMAFDQTFSRYSPSKLLMLHILQHLDEEGVVTTLDHMSGPSMLKKDFCNVEFARSRLVAHNHRRLTSIAKHNCYLATRLTYKFGATRLRKAEKALRLRGTKQIKAAVS